MYGFFRYGDLNTWSVRVFSVDYGDLLAGLLDLVTK